MASRAECRWQVLRGGSRTAQGVSDSEVRQAKKDVWMCHTSGWGLIVAKVTSECSPTRCTDTCIMHSHLHIFWHITAHHYTLPPSHHCTSTCNCTSLHVTAHNTFQPVQLQYQHWNISCAKTLTCILSLTHLRMFTSISLPSLPFPSTSLSLHHWDSYRTQTWLWCWVMVNKHWSILIKSQPSSLNCYDSHSLEVQSLNAHQKGP